MRRYTDIGGWYGDVNLNGIRVSLHRDSHIVVGEFELDTERIELPLVNNVKDNVLFLVSCDFNGQLYLAGQSNLGVGNYIYEDGKWRVISPSFGTFTCAFGGDALYLVVGPNQYRIYDLESRQLTGIINRQLGAQGIRYIDFSQNFDGIVTSDETYGPVPYNLSQWTLRNTLTADVVAGQSYVDGAIIQAIAHDYKVEPGDCQFLRFYTNEDSLAIAIVKMAEVKTVFYWMTVSELIVDFPPEFPGTGEPPMADTPQAPNKLSTIERMIDTHPEINTMDENERGKILDYSAVEDNPPNDNRPWGRKARNSDGSNKNTDGYCFLRSDSKFEIYDVINGTNGQASWDFAGIFKQGENGWWAPAEPVDDVEPGPVPPTDPIKVEKDDVRNGSNAIIAFYNEPIGLNRAARGIPSPIDVHDQACWDWIAAYTTKLAEGKTAQVALKEVIDQIKTFPEYIEQHP